MNKKYLILNLICASVLLFANGVTPIKFNKITGSTPMYTADNFNKLLSNTDISFGSDNINSATNKSTIVGHNNYLNMDGSGIFGDDSMITNEKLSIFDDILVENSGMSNGAFWGNYSFGSYNTNSFGDTVFQFGKYLTNYNGNRNILIGQFSRCLNCNDNILLGLFNGKENVISDTTYGEATIENIMLSTNGSNITDSKNSITIGQHNIVENSITSIAVGNAATVKDSTGSVAIGSGANVSNANYSIQIGNGTNTEGNTVKIFNTTIVNKNGTIPLDSLENADEIKAAIGIQTISRTALPQKLSNNASNQEIIDTLNTIIEILNSDLQGTRAPE